MTSPLRRRRPITVRGRSTPARTAPSLAALALLLAPGIVAAQEVGRPVATTYSTWPPTTPQVSYNQAIPAQRAAYQPPAGLPGGTSDELQQGYQIQLEPPGLERLQMSLQSEESLKERIRQENRQRVPMERVIFPEEPILSREVYYGRGPIWPERQELVIPNFVCYKRLLFEEKNSERYGWDLGILQPLISAGAFYADVVTLPYHAATDPCRCYECSAGYCLPGDPVPYLLYPPDLSVTGTLAEAGTILALVAIFP